MDAHRRARGLLHRLRIALALLAPLRHRPADRQIAVDRIVRRGLVGDDVRATPRRTSSGQHLGGVAEQADGLRLAGPGPALDHGERLVEGLGLLVDVAGAQAEIDRVRIALDGEAAGAGHDRGERLRAAHAAEAAGQHPLAGEIAAIVLAAGLHEGLVGALHDALRADVDPRAGRHLAVHGEALAIELVEMVPGRPVRHEVGVGDQHARRVGVGAEHADRLAGLDEQRLVLARASSAPRRCGRNRPRCARPGRCRHRRPVRAGSRRRRGRGCSSACGAAPRSSRNGRRARCRAGRGRRGCCGADCPSVGPSVVGKGARGPVEPREDFGEDRPQPVRLGGVVGEGRRLGCQMRRLRQLHLDRVDAGLRPAVVAGRPAAAEAAVERRGYSRPAAVTASMTAVSRRRSQVVPPLVPTLKIGQQAVEQERESGTGSSGSRRGRRRRGVALTRSISAASAAW